jgi:abortive infection bacteriophage resistance protein
LQYQHPPTTIDQQIQFLQSRGIVGDEELIRRWLKTVGYYRLSAYWLPLELPRADGETRSKRFPPDTNFADIVDIYIFDRQLRLLIMEAIDRFEIAVRARWTNLFSLAHGSHAHMNHNNFQDGFEYAKMFSKISNTVEQSSEVFIEHYRDKYNSPYLPPLWQVTELMTLGEISKWVKATKDNNMKDAVAKDLGLPNKETLEGTLQLLSYVRNICAHHGRLWNRRTVKRALNIRNFRQDMDIEVTGDQHQPRNSIYNVLVILAKTLRHQSPDTTFPDRVGVLVNTRSANQLRAMGFPEDWKERPIWLLT